MKAATHSQSIAVEIEAALDMLQAYKASVPAVPITDSFPSLLDQCEAMCQSFTGPEPIRTLHHFACSGGTLIAKCIAALPGVVLLNEIDPLSQIHLPENRRAPKFAPTDLFGALQISRREVNPTVVVDGFREATQTIVGGLASRGQSLVIRDHAHSHFCTQIDPNSRPTLHEILATGRHPVVSLLTVRHPLDSFLSLHANGWLHFSPSTLETYSQRYAEFLDRHADLDLVRYEDFVAAPERTLEKICQIIALPYHASALELFTIIRLSGDSGRKGEQIAERPRREVPVVIDAQRGSRDYKALCVRLGYEP
ncbi:sulfotransferase [Roseovarius mucosus]|uniref:sulfotransferase n=1 Tax=Roseovarius mucosus TaxID=215743 RepID=UPI0035CF06FD|tara:strand:- start:673 stop:1602 length:930 start_codon:yes stop_codon:yes gene_type:complete